MGENIKVLPGYVKILATIRLRKSQGRDIIGIKGRYTEIYVNRMSV